MEGRGLMSPRIIYGMGAAGALRNHGRRTLRCMMETAMHKTLAFAAAALLGSATLAVAQPSPPAPGADAPPAPMRERMRGEMQPGMGGMMEHHPGMMTGGMRGPRGARFVFEREGAMIDLKCADNETTRACVDAAAVLIDKLAPTPAR